MLIVCWPGSYSFAKTLEYKAKQGLNNNLITSSQKEVTVIPPAEYRDRFVKAIDSYFLACPGRSFLVPCDVLKLILLRRQVDQAEGLGLCLVHATALQCFIVYAVSCSLSAYDGAVLY